MFMFGRPGRMLLFAAGMLVGAGAVCFVKSGKAKKAAVAITNKGLELKDRVAGATERFKESVDDVMAEAKYVSEQKTTEN